MSWREPFTDRRLQRKYDVPGFGRVENVQYKPITPTRHRLGASPERCEGEYFEELSDRIGKKTLPQFDKYRHEQNQKKLHGDFQERKKAEREVSCIQKWLKYFDQKTECTHTNKALHFTFDGKNLAREETQLTARASAKTVPFAKLIEPAKKLKCLKEYQFMISNPAYARQRAAKKGA